MLMFLERSRCRRGKLEAQTEKQRLEMNERVAEAEAKMVETTAFYENSSFVAFKPINAPRSF